MSSIPKSQPEWRKALASLPPTPSKIPAFFFAHGSPLLAFPESQSASLPSPMVQYAGPNGPLASFLRDFGPVLLRKYKPKGIVVFSAHWETRGERLVTNYGDDNPLLMDYYGFEPSLYELRFKSRGDHVLSERVVQLYKEAGLAARLTPRSEPRGRDGRGFNGLGLDHGVFVPFRLMFGEEFIDVPIVQVSIDASLSPEKNWTVGEVLAPLREEGILILSGGLTVHNLRDMSSFSELTAGPPHKQFDSAIQAAVGVTEPQERKNALFSLTQHAHFRACHPREDHFVPLYVAAGAGLSGNVVVLNGLYGAPTFAFGL